MNTFFTIQLKGYSDQPIYDEHPLLGTFRTRWTDVYQQHQTLKEAIEAVLALAKQAEWPSDTFIPDAFFITDHEKKLVLSGAFKEAGVSYFEPIFDDKQIEDIQEECSKLRSEASFEGGWDNHETARCLRHQADMLSLKLVDKHYENNLIIQYYRGQ